jgi:1,4-dihydroxy-2-naphthoate octaprenyltransferase
MAGEVSAGLGLGFLPVLGAFMVHQPVVSPGCLILAVAAGILTFNLLLLNEFPDMEADRQGGRRNLVIALGPKRAAKLYASLTVTVYAILVIFVVLGTIPTLSLLGLMTVPFAYKAAAISFTDPEEVDHFVHGMTANVKVVLMTQALVAVGIVASILMRV